MTSGVLSEQSAFSCDGNINEPSAKRGRRAGVNEESSRRSRGGLTGAAGAAGLLPADEHGAAGQTLLRGTRPGPA